MRTPAGKECRYFYGNYHRGRGIEECRLLHGRLPVAGLEARAVQHLPGPRNPAEQCLREPDLAAFAWGADFAFLKQNVRVKPLCSKTTPGRL